MNSDFKSWYSENADFFEMLYSNNSVLFYHIKDILDSLAYINASIENEGEKGELEDIFDAGYTYLYLYISSLKIYLKQYFDNDTKEFLKYETVLRYNFYINDLKELLIEDSIYKDEIKDVIDNVLNDIEDVLKNKNVDIEAKIDEYDNIIEGIIPKDKYYETIPELFTHVIDNLEV